MCPIRITEKAAMKNDTHLGRMTDNLIRIAELPDGGPKMFAGVMEVPDWTPASLNQYIGNKWKLHRMKKAAAEFLSFYVYKSRVRMVTNEYRPVREVLFTTWHSCSVLPDRDNLSKLTLDVLRRIRVIVDDSSEWLLTELPTVLRSSDHEGREWTQFRIRDVELKPAISIEDDPEYKRFLARHNRRKGKSP